MFWSKMLFINKTYRIISRESKNAIVVMILTHHFEEKTEIGKSGRAFPNEEDMYYTE